ncbi:MAG: hydrogenase, partial [Candidatus Hydrogenedentes bacterium]|nr:hydrogenase [Candidatus Hydrogenedentota bacterium]
MAELRASLREPWIRGNKEPIQVSDDICGILERRPTGLWWLAFLASSSVLAIGTA